MSEQDPNIDYLDLISRYLSGNATDAEVRQLEEWVLAAPENRAGFMAFKKTWMLSGIEMDASKLDVQHNWEATSRQLDGQARMRPLRTGRKRRNWLGIAAAIALSVAVSLWIFQDLLGEKVVNIHTSDTIKTFDLPDGSRVTLNQESSLVYTPQRKEGRRLVELHGDAFFEVEREEKRPFIIHAQGLEIEVLGTSFYVDARPTQPEVQVIVESGTVAVRSDSPAPIVLEANDKAIYQKSEGNLSAVANADPNYLAIKTNTLIFDNASLEEVIFVLERQFNVRIESQIEDPGNCIIRNKFENYSLDDILELIASTWEIEFSRSTSGIILSGSGCK